MNTLRDCAQAPRAVVDRVHRGDDSEKNLGRTNDARGFVAADVLFARLQGESISRTAFGIMRNANETTRHVTLELVARGEVCRVRSTKPHWHAKTLRVPHGDIGAEFARRFQ